MHLQQTISLIFIIVCVLFHEGSCTDVYLTCPSTWLDGQTVTLTCDVLIRRWAQPDPCTDVYSDTLEFILRGSPVCTVNSVPHCDGVANIQGCGCTTNTTHYKFFYKLVANKNLYSKGDFSCQPDCLTFDTVPPSNPLYRYTTEGCHTITFRSFQTVDIAMTCPSEWVDGQTARLTCEVLISRWTQPDPCSDSFSATVDFMFQPFRSDVETRECTVHTQLCNGELNPQGCSCSKNATHYKLHYVSKLNKMIHNKGAYSCQPDCFDAVQGFNPLKSVDTESCKSINFREPCDNNVCRTGSCSINNAEAQCSCDGTYYKGQRCEDDPCVGAGARTCYALKGNDNKRQCLTGFSGDKCEACGFGDCGETCKCTGLIVFIVIVVVIGTNSLNAFVTLARAKMVQRRPRPKGSRYEADARQEEPAHAQYQAGKATVGGKLVNQDEPSTVADDSSQASSWESETDAASDKDGKGNYGKK